MYNVPYGDTQQLNLDWFIKRWKEFYAEWQAAEAGIDGALDAEIEKVENAMQDLYAARDAAAASATAAAASASSASTDATAASNAATAAAASATLANNKAAAAGLSEANAAQSATSAGNSASAAATSATQANASDVNATASAQAAAGSATAAAGSATAAAGSASAAATSETNAAASAQEAEDVLDSIPADYSALSNHVDEINAEVNSLLETQFSSFEEKTISNVAVANFNNGAENTPLKELVVSAMFTAEGAGTPSPENARNPLPISSCKVYKSGEDTSTPTETNIALTSTYGSNVDVLRGIQTRTHTRVRLSSSWVWYRQEISGVYYFCAAEYKSSLQTYKDLRWCSHFQNNGNTSTIGTNSNKTIRNAYSRYYPLNIRYDECTTVAAFTQFLSDNEVYIVLATSLATYSTTPEEILTLKGINNFWCDSGNIVTLTYRALNNADTLITETKHLIAPILETMQADTALTANDFRIVGNTLYKITAPISAGATLIPNTNCVATTVGAVLKTLLT